MAELAYALGLGPSVARLEGSSPSVRIILNIGDSMFLAHKIGLQESVGAKSDGLDSYLIFFTQTRVEFP